MSNYQPVSEFSWFPMIIIAAAILLTYFLLMWLISYVRYSFTPVATEKKKSKKSKKSESESDSDD